MNNNDKPAILFISLNPHQRTYFHRLGDSLKDLYDVHYIHYGLSDFIGALKRPELPEIVAFTQGELADMLRFLLVKAKFRKFSGFRGWMHSQAVLESQAHFATLHFYNYIRHNNIELVCIWNGTLVPLSAAARVARKLGKKTLFFENGYLPNTTTVDPLGVNNRNSLVGKPRSFYDAVIPQEQCLALLYSGSASIRALKTKWYHRLIKRKPKNQIEKVTLPEKYIFLPFQVHDDTQVLLHSPYIKSMEELVDCVAKAVKQHNLIHNDDIWIVAKEHPSDFGRVDYSALKEKYQGEKLLFLRYYQTPDLITQAKGVITLNSSVGIESLVRHKPVITLGKAFYNVEGLVHHVAVPGQLVENIQVVNTEPDHELIDKFLFYLRYHYLAEGSWRQPDKEHFESVAAKIATVLC